MLNVGQHKIFIVWTIISFNFHRTNDEVRDFLWLYGGWVDRRGESLKTYIQKGIFRLHE